MYYNVIVYSTTDGVDIEVVVPDDMDEEDVDQYIEENYPTVNEYQVEANY